MKPFFASLALRIKKGQSGLTGNEITFETEGCAQDLKTALDELGIASAVVRVGRQHKVRLHNLSAAETVGQPLWQVEACSAGITPAEPADPVTSQGTAETRESSKDVPSLVLKGSEAAAPGLPAKEKRRRFAELATQEHLETGRKLEQSQLELSFSAARKTVRRRKK